MMLEDVEPGKWYWVHWPGMKSRPGRVMIVNDSTAVVRVHPSGEDLVYRSNQIFGLMAEEDIPRTFAEDCAAFFGQYNWADVAAIAVIAYALFQMMRG